MATRNQGYAKRANKKPWVKKEEVVPVRPPKTDYSDEQGDVFRAGLETDHDIVITAAAGSGKTFTLSHLAWQVADRRPDYKMGYFVFNTRNKAEAETKFPPSCVVKNFHGLGMSILKSAGSIYVDEHKVWNFLGKMIPDPTVALPEGTEAEKKEKKKQKEAFSRQKFLVKKLIDMARLTLMDLTVTDMAACAVAQNINLSAPDIEVAHRVLTEMNRQFRGNKTEIIPTKTVHVDFTDMLYLPVRFESAMKWDDKGKFDMVMVDEFQDVSPVIKSLIWKWAVGRFTRTVVVGDKGQAIYEFAGASTHFFDEASSAPNAVTLTLGTCYRCRPAIVAEAQKYVDYIYPWSGHEDQGEVITDGNYLDAVEGDFILSRKNRPVVAICLAMLGEGKKAVVRGRDIAESLSQMLADIGAEDNQALANGLEAYEVNWLAKMQKQRGWDAQRARRSPDYESLMDRIGVVTDMMGNGMVPSQIAATIDSIFSDKENINAVILSTVHKAKGLEANTVYILDICDMDDNRLKYVAVTRARYKLVYCKYEGCDKGGGGGSRGDFGASELEMAAMNLAHDVRMNPGDYNI